MKVHFKYNIGAFSGKLEDGIWYYHPRLKVSLMRLYAVASRNPSAVRLKAVMKNLKTIQPGEDYKRNFRDYLLAFNELKVYRHTPVLTWNNLWLKLLYAMQKALPGIDLTTLSREQIYEQDLPCKTLKRAIEAGLLPVVKNYQRFTAEI